MRPFTEIFRTKKTALRVVQGFQQTPGVVSYPQTRRSNSLFDYLNLKSVGTIIAPSFVEDAATIPLKC